jgi:hypothetical protein
MVITVNLKIGFESSTVLSRGEKRKNRAKTGLSINCETELVRTVTTCLVIFHVRPSIRQSNRPSITGRWVSQPSSGVPVTPGRQLQMRAPRMFPTATGTPITPTYPTSHLDFSDFSPSPSSTGS